jgi:NAD(P)-dependent dehydrogenase (short-subunit alcohol dehydrogenase family)
MDLGLAGRVAVVVGASEGIGKAVARTLAGEGAHVVMLARTTATLEAAAADVRTVAAQGVDVTTIATDITVRDQVDAAARQVGERYPVVHVVINNAGNRMQPGRQIEWSDEDWLRDVDAKLFGMLRVLRAFDALLADDGSGRVVNVSGVAGTVVWDTALTHGINNAAINHIVKYLATDLAKRQITVNAVIPGLIATDWRHDWARSKGADLGITEASFVDDVCRRKGILLGRWAEPSEVADAIVFLASSRASYITGTTLLVDGGLGANAH